jgi:hypothetical protein
MKRSSRPRATVELPKCVTHQLNAYALAAGAAGVGLLALAQPAEAKIIYTPAHSKVVDGHPVPLDLNHDRIVDFYVLEFASRYRSEDGLAACQVLGTGTTGGTFCDAGKGTNAIEGSMRYAAALRKGAKIRQVDHFSDSGLLGGVKGVSQRSSSTYWFGPWVNGGKGVKNRYLGLKFKINGRFHFGWARLTVTTTKNDFTATLTGYAYETIPGKGIVAGKTKGPDVTTVDPTSLGHLAAGASAIPAWRRSKQATGSTP